MNSIVWLGSQEDARALGPVLSALGLELVSVADLDAALRALAERNAGVLVVASDWRELEAAVARVGRARPVVQVLVATRLGVPEHVSTALDDGVSGIVDLRALDPARAASTVARALGRHERAMRERELLRKLHELNEEFLKAMVVLDKRNVELEETLHGEGDDVGKRRVLVIDDEPTLCTLLEMVLLDHGYDVVTAADAEAGLQAFRTQYFHVVVTDKNLPRMDGIALMRELKRLRPEVDVILVTAFGSKESAIAALDLGAAAFLEKPFDDIDDVAKKVDEVVEKQKERQRKREFLRLFKERNHDFLDKYRVIRSDLEAWMAGGAAPGDPEGKSRS